MSKFSYNPQQVQAFCFSSTTKQRYRLSLFISLMLLFAISCRQTSIAQEGCEEIYAALRKAESLMTNHPDSTLSILNAIWRDNEGRLTNWEQWAIYKQRCVVSRFMLDFGMAETYCRRSLDFANKMNDPVSQASSFAHLGVIEFSRGRQRNAIDFYRQAIDLLDEENQEFITQLYLNIAGAFLGAEQVDSALYFLQIVRTDDLRAQALVFAHTAAIFTQIGDYQQAEEYYRKTLSFFLQENNIPSLITAYINISNALLGQNRVEEAMLYAKKSDEMARSIGAPTISLRAVYVHKGQEYYSKGSYHESLRMFYLALEEATRRQNTRLMAADHNNIGKVYIRLRDSNQAEFHTSKALEIAIQNDNSEIRLRSLRNLTSVHVLRGDVEKFERTTATKQALQDSLLALQHDRTVQLLEMQSEAERRELLLAQQAKEIRHTRANNILLAIILSLVVALSVTGFLFYRYKMREISFTVRHYEELLKYKKDAQQPESESTENQSEKLAAKLQHLFEIEKVYRQQGLTVDAVAKMLKTNSKYLSNAIRENYKKHFTEYVNTYRVEEAIEMLKEQCKGGKYANYSTEMIADEVGFNGRTSFYSAFKRIIGVAPKEYMDILNLQKEIGEDAEEKLKT